MTDEFDGLFRDRLARLADAVPMDPSPGTAPVALGRVLPDSTGRSFAWGGLLPVLALVTVVVLVALAGWRFGPGSRHGAIALLTASGPHDGECLLARAEGRLAEHPTSGLGLADRNGHVFKVQWPFGFTAAQTSDGAVLYDENGEVYAREGERVVLGGGSSPNDEVFYVCGPSLRGSMSPAAPSPSTSDAGIQPDGSVRAVVDTGSIELSISSPSSVVLADEPFAVLASYAYLGPLDQTIVSADYPVITFGIDQLNATAPTDIGLGFVGASCQEATLDRGVVNNAPFGPITSIQGDGVDGDWAESHVDGSNLRLPAGDWRVSMTLSAYFAPECAGRLRSLTASIDIKVVPTTGMAIDLRTASEPSEGCYTQYSSGRLAVDPRSGLGVIEPDGDLVAVTWPFGFTARPEPSGAVLIGDDGEVIAREGDTVGFTGGPSADGSIFACTGVARVAE
jgi:hypothetical protein